MPDTIPASPQSPQRPRAARRAFVLAPVFTAAALLAARAAFAQAVPGAPFVPHVTFGVSAGYALRTPEAREALWAHGVGWGASAGVQIQPWIELEGRYFGFVNLRASPSEWHQWLTNAGAGVVRLAVPIPFVRPYVLAGAGGYFVSFRSTALPVFGAQSSAAGTSYFGIPLGGGLEIVALGSARFGLEVVWHPLFRTGAAVTPEAAVTDLVTGVLAFRYVL